MQALAKEKTAATNFVANLEKQYDWIQDESEYVRFSNIWISFQRLIVLLLKSLREEGHTIRLLSCGYHPTQGESARTRRHAEGYEEEG